MSRELFVRKFDVRTLHEFNSRSLSIILHDILLIVILFETKAWTALCGVTEIYSSVTCILILLKTVVKQMIQPLGVETWDTAKLGDDSSSWNGDAEGDRDWPLLGHAPGWTAWADDWSSFEQKSPQSRISALIAQPYASCLQGQTSDWDHCRDVAKKSKGFDVLVFAEIAFVREDLLSIKVLETVLIIY